MSVIIINHDQDDSVIVINHDQDDSVIVMHDDLLHCMARGETSATTLVSVRNTRVFRTALTALTEPRTL
jgi:hypothetical protein